MNEHNSSDHAGWSADLGCLCRVFLTAWSLQLCSPAIAESASAGLEEWTTFVVASGLDRPEAVVPLDGKTALVGERSGRILFVGGAARRIDLGHVSIPGSKIFYVPERPFSEGLKDLIADGTRPGTYLWCSTSGSEEGVSWTVGRTTLVFRTGTPTGLEDELIWQSAPRPWMRSSPPPFMGCRMAADGNDVVVAMGANSRAVGSGQVVRVSMSGSHEARLVSTGHRNPSGLALHDSTLWEIEHGPKGGDELNVIVAGQDYGWPDVSQGTPDDGAHVSFLRSRNQSVDPTLTWSPAIAPSGMASWAGGLYVGGLQCQCVVDISIRGTEIVRQRRILGFDRRVRDVRVGRAEHQLWVLTDGPDAKLMRLELRALGTNGSTSDERVR